VIIHMKKSHRDGQDNSRSVTQVLCRDKNQYKDRNHNSLGNSD